VKSSCPWANTITARISPDSCRQPDVVLISLIGTDSIVFNRAFAEHGLASKMLRLGGAMDETVLLGIGADNSENLFCASGYFVEMKTRENDLFRSNCEASYGRNAPPIGSIARRIMKASGSWKRSRRVQGRLR